MWLCGCVVVQWFVGAIPRSEESLHRLLDVTADSFHIITKHGLYTIPPYHIITCISHMHIITKHGLYTYIFMYICIYAGTDVRMISTHVSVCTHMHTHAHTSARTRTLRMRVRTHGDTHKYAGAHMVAHMVAGNGSRSTSLLVDRRPAGTPRAHVRMHTHGGQAAANVRCTPTR